MKTEIKNVLHLYLGCKLFVDHPAAAFNVDVLDADMLLRLLSGDLDIQNFKLLLRHLSDMTEEEFKEQTIKCLDIRYMNHTSGYYSPEEFSYLLSKHFDLFNLLESGQAINATTLKQKA